MLNKETYRICEKKLYYLNYADSTIKMYMHYIDEFLSKQDQNMQRINSKDFQVYLDDYNFTSISKQNQVINAIRFLYKYGLNKKYDKVSFKRPIKEKKLPRIIDKDLLKNKILSIKNKKHKAILSLAYSCGLRVSEVINLRIEDVDSKRMLINIRQAKGRKDRVVPLSENLLEILRDYFKFHKPKEYLFNGQLSDRYTASSCNKIVKKYISEDSHMHLLRHSCFTHLLENGTDLRIIQKIAGHNSIKTTEIYTHVSNNFLQKVKMPI